MGDEKTPQFVPSSETDKDPLDENRGDLQKRPKSNLDGFIKQSSTGRKEAKNEFPQIEVQNNRN